MITDTMNRYFRVLESPDIVSGDNNIILMDPDGSQFRFRADVNLDLISEVGLPIRLTKLDYTRDEPSRNLVIRFSVETDVQTQYASLQISSTLKTGVKVVWSKRVKVHKPYVKEISNISIFDSENNLFLGGNTSSSSGTSSPLVHFRQLSQETSIVQDVGTSPLNYPSPIVPYNTWFKVSNWGTWLTDQDASFTLGSRIKLETIRGVFDDPCVLGGGLINLELRLESTGSTPQPSGSEFWDIVATQSSVVVSGTITDAATSSYVEYFHLKPGIFSIGSFDQDIWSDRFVNFTLSGKVTASNECVASASLTGSITFERLIPFMSSVTTSAATTGVYVPPSLTIFDDVSYWYDFSDSDTITTDGATSFITEMSNKGSEDNIIFASSSRPFLSSSVQNSLDVGYFEPNIRYFGTVDVSSVISDEFTSFIVFQLDANSLVSSGPFGIINSSDSANTGYTILRNGIFLQSRIENDTANANSITYSPLPGPFILVSTKVSGTDFETWFDGVSDGANSSVTTPMYQSLNLGRQKKGNSGYHSGFIGELLVYNSILSDSDINEVNSYLINKWGI